MGSHGAQAASLIVLLLLAVPAATAQTSASFQLTESLFNAGGAPAGGSVPHSSGFSITLASKPSHTASTSSAGRPAHSAAM